MFQKTLEEATAGDQMGILTKGIKRGDVRRGMGVGKPGSFQQCDNFDAQVYVLTKAEGGLGRPMLHEKPLTVFSKTWDCTGFIMLKKDMLMPGEDSPIQIKMIKPMVVG